MIPITFEEAVGYFGIYVFVVAMCFALIVSLYHLADFVEEHLKATKKVVLYTTQGSLALLALLWALEGVDPLTMAPTVAAQLGYWRVVHRQFPFLSIRNPLLAGSAGMTVWSHVMWMKYHLSTFHHISVVLGFFLVVVWLVPFMILISMAANENCLPGVASGMPTQYYAANSPAGGAGRAGAGAEGGAGAGASGVGSGAGRAGGRGRGTRTLLGSLFDSVGQFVPQSKGKDRDW